ncbi:transcriptional regulator (plasmid) [Rhodococcus sp. ZPP]|uniref:helix-turn-helix transcriptional regulator n=1 Tax=Rhodococcus sp. ZPP TaxID=2749906 RepID=UPI001AD850B1|nr:transcriptional regulator [Rhodococcus sp. ZPP]QTJ70241.1 transcriptional regulator [Rhodococcus sp. ZPP]
MARETGAAFPSALQIKAIAALDDDLRRGLYEFGRRAGRPVTRDEAAAAVGISRKLAAFHLDKLVAAGLLRAHYEPVGGIRRVGRTPKVYEPTGDGIHVAIPARHHEVLAEILIDAVMTEGAGESARAAAMRVAAARGEDLGSRERARYRPGRLGAERALTLAEEALTPYGFEPARSTPTCVHLRNCPFHPLAAHAPDLVCGINHSFLTGFVTGLQAHTVHAVLAPTDGQCCVHLTADPPAEHVGGTSA